MEEINKIKAEALDIRLRLDEAEMQVNNFNQQTLVPLRKEYQSLLNKAAELITAKQEADKKDKEFQDSLQVVS